MDEQSSMLRLVVHALKLESDDMDGSLRLYTVLRALKEIMAIKHMEMADLQLSSHMLEWLLSDGEEG